MAIKVTGQHPPRTGELAGQRTRETDAQGQAKGGRAAGSTQRPGPAAPAQPTQPALTTLKVKEAIRDTPDVRADRVAEVRNKIEQGRYQVDADKLATKVLNDSLREDLEKP